MTASCFGVTKLIFILLAVRTISSAIVDDEEAYCSGHQFTSEPRFEGAFIGKPKILSCCAKTYSKLEWYKEGHLIDNSRKFTTFYLLTSKNRTIISQGIVKADEGKYICEVHDGTGVIIRKKFHVSVSAAPLIKHPKYPRLFKYVLLLVALFGFVLLYIMSTCMEWKLELKLWCKDKYGKLEVNDDKKYDVFVCYDQKDAEFVMEILVYRLEKQFEYCCFTYERNSFAEDSIPETFAENVRLSRRFLMIVSRAVAVNNWCTYALSIALEAMLNDNSRIICLMLEEIPWYNLTNGTSDNQALMQALRVIPKVPWQAASTPPRTKHKRKKNNLKDKIIDPRTSTTGSVRFWRALRLHLPPRRVIQRMIEFKL